MAKSFSSRWLHLSFWMPPDHSSHLPVCCLQTRADDHRSFEALRIPGEKNNIPGEGESSLEFLVFHKRTRWLEWATARHLAQGEGPGKVCTAKSTRVGARHVLSNPPQEGFNAYFVYIVSSVHHTSHFTLFDFGMRSHECTERGWRSKSVSFSIAFHPFLWNRLSEPGAHWLTHRLAG